MSAPRPFCVDDLPRDLTRSARAALAFCMLRCRTDTGEVEHKDGLTPQQRIAKWCGWDGHSAASAAASELEERRYVAQPGSLARRRLFVLICEPSLFSDSLPRCEICGGEPQKIRGAKVCAACLQGPVRRGWKGEALEMWRLGKLRGDTDGVIVYAIHNKVRRVDAEGVRHAIPLWGRAEDGVAGSGSGAGEGLVPAMVEMGVLDESWLVLAKRARRGDEMGEE